MDKIEDRKLIKVEGWESLARDSSSGAIINVSSSEREAWLRRKKKTEATEKRISSLEDKIKDMGAQLEAQSAQMEKVLGSLETLLNVIKQQKG